MGRNGFIWGVIEECDFDMLNDKEIYWIAKYDTFNNGYNSTIGGESKQKYMLKGYCRNSNW
jgi:hypothetical protein